MTIALKWLIMAIYAYDYLFLEDGLMMDIFEMLQEYNPDVWGSFTRCAQEFSSDFNPEGYDWGYRINFDSDKGPMSYMVFISMAFLLNYKHFGKEEKVAWTIPFTYKGEQFIATHRKLGFRLCASTEAMAESALSKEMVNKLRKVTQVADKVIEPIINEQIDRCNYSVVNRCSEFYDRYLFFRDRAKEAYQTPPPEAIYDEQGNVNGKIYNIYRQEKEGFYFTQAMLDAYFSYLEHVLILLTAFKSDFQPEVLNYRKIVFKDFTSKFNIVLDPQHNPKHMSLYNKLRDLKEKYRNTFAHGGFEKNGSPIFVHFPLVGAIPLTLSEFKDDIIYSAIPIKEEDYSSICGIIDEFENYLNDEGFSGEMKIIKAGLDIQYDSNSRRIFGEALKSTARLDEFIEREMYSYEQSVNMEW
jgi:hypothetical protein